MFRTRSGFTLIELLVVLAIVSVIAGVLFPVFSSAKASAQRNSCLMNFRQVGQATSLYGVDYDDRFVPVNHQPAETPNSRNDRTWVQLLMPYVRRFSVFSCPSDASSRPRPEATFDQDLVPGDLYSEFYTASLHVNVGYNFQYLAPILRFGDQWISMPKSMTELPDPSRTLVYIDSVWEVKNGVPSGGGSWLVSPPCRYEEVQGTQIDTFLSVTTMAHTRDQVPIPVYAPVVGWDPGETSSKGPYGGAWPRHFGRMNVARADGSARSITVAGLEEGCRVLPNWAGSIYDPSRYVWFAR